jgi:site-specific DNA recombinase
MKAASYIRVSTEEQAREGYGLAAQDHAIRSYCQAHGWELADVYADAGRSGKSTRGREELARLLEDASKGRFQRVVFWKLDRFGRNLRDLLDNCDRLETLGIGIVSVQEAIDTGTAAGRMVRSFLGAVAEFERETIVERIKAGLAQKARQGELLGTVPLGYVRDDSGAIVLDTLTAPLIREAFTRYATGDYSLVEMANWAGQVGLRSIRGNPLDKISMGKLLRNVSYAGQVTYHARRGGGIVAKGKHPPIVDVACFAQVQERLASRRHYWPPARPFGRDPYPLSGVAVCGFDGAPLLGVKASKAGHHYMRCSTAHRHGRSACPQPMVRLELLLEQVATYVRGMRLPPEYLGAIVAELRARRAPSKDRDDAERTRRELERWRRLFVLGEIDEVRLKAETAPLKRTLAEAERPQEVLDVERAINYLRDMGTLWAESSRHLQRQFTREVFDRIVVEGPQVTAITPKAIYAPLFLLDRRERFEGKLEQVGVDWYPRQDSNLQPPD